MGIRYNRASGLPMHDDGQQWRVLGALPSKFKAFALPDLKKVYYTIPESQWRETALTDWVKKIPVYNQGQYGSCVGHGSVTAFTFSWLLSGQDAHLFSPTSVYARINGGQDKGAQVASGLMALKQFGTCLQSQFGEDEIYARQLSQDAVQTALRFRAFEAYNVNSWVDMGTALMNGLIIVSGFAVGQNFSQLMNGVVPVPDMVVGGHCMAHYGLKKINGAWVILSRNSWGEQWGLSGDCYMQKGIWDPRFGFGFDAYAIGGVLDDPQTTTDDPPILTT